VLQGARTFILQDSDGQIMNTHSISAGLDYAAVGPEHAWLRDEGRAEYTFCTDEEALEAFRFLSETEGIIPAMESAHAIAEAMKLAPTLAADQTIVISLSGRGDKDVEQVARVMGLLHHHV
jgi:tryptophan synthase beta subunit